MNKYFVIYGGGGIRGISYCGAYKAMLENEIEITGCAGSSIGAVFASLNAVGYDYDEIFEFLSSVGLGMFADFNFDIKKEVAFSKGQNFYEWMKEKIEKKFYKENYKKGSLDPVCFKDIDKNLVIFSVDLAKMEFKEFSRAKTPDYEIARAVRASVSMPGLFTPLEDEENYLVDGDLLKSTPLWRLSDTIKNLNERILEFRLEDNENQKHVSNPVEYINRVYNAICGFATDYIIDLYNQKDKFDYIKINTPDVSVVDFLIPKQRRQELFDIGYQTTKNYLQNDLKAKKIVLKNKYNALFKKFSELQKAYFKNDFCLAHLKLCEIFILLCEEKRFIDSVIYENIINFKDLFFESYKVQFNFLGFKKAMIKDNKEEISSKLLEIIKSLTFKVEELA